MTEEQKQALISRCNYLIGGAPEIDVQLAEFALAALTQPASPAFKLPDGWVAVPHEATREMIESGWTYYLITKDPSAKGIWACMIAAAPSVPHTAPIEPICATGGAIKLPFGVEVEEYHGVFLAKDEVISAIHAAGHQVED